MNRLSYSTLLSLGVFISVTAAGCNPTTTPEGQSGANVSPSSAPAVATPNSPTSTPTSSSEKSATIPATQPSTGSPSPVANPQSGASRPPLTVEKLKNAEYFFLAKGSIKLTNGTYEDQATKRIYTLSDVVAYGDLNKDGVKDAVTALTVSIPNTGNFSYLVVLVNEAGLPKNISAEFMGPQVKVKTLKINPDNSIEAVMDQYQAGDPECCPSLKITRTYQLKSNQTPTPKPASPQ